MPQFIMSKSQMQPTGRSVVTIRHLHKQSGKNVSTKSTVLR